VGQVFAILCDHLAAAERLVGLAILSLLYRNRENRRYGKRFNLAALVISQPLHAA